MEESELKCVDLDGEDGTKEMRGTKRKISLSSCEACGAEEAKYRCPACLKHSCSLPCVKKHKSDSGCTGVRDKTAFVPLSRFDEMTLLSDYRFLEDAGRLADSIARDRHRLPQQKNQKARTLRLGAHRLNLQLMLLPNGFTKRRENSTFFNKRECRFYWHVKLLFPESSTEYRERRVPDNRTLKEILTPYIHPTESEPVKRQKLKVYVRDSFDGVRVFMKVENRKYNSMRYHELALQDTLLDNLRNKTVIEYPVLHVSLRDHCERYVLLEKEVRGGSVTPCNVKTTSGITEPAIVKSRSSLGREDEELEEGEISDSE
ncbi:box C/D snoRNA protein 1 isoform X2 [Brienomyrus brachyistius]|uniref:box C/D snoRNA protein 1 isoform X2 n=1 Tax=Brienomyrus brachyistius TaxID=42636 RepID=UPI0020B2FBF4|nr:box C/D snoRNA protein 1 isoform X2 [Brienomyrus brachyistius]